MCVCVVCVCKGHNRHNYLCLRGPVRGGGRRGEAEFNNGSTTGFVCTEQRADKCRLLLTIYTLLHTPAHVHITQRRTHSVAGALPCLFSLCVPIKRTHTHSDTHTCSMSMFTVYQCISVNQCKRERRESPCEHITLTEIWPLSHPSSQAVCEREEESRGSLVWIHTVASIRLQENCSLLKV